MADANGNGNGNGAKTLLDSAYLRAALMGITLILVPVMGWTLGQVNVHGQQIAVLQAELTLRTASRYTSEDAQRDQERINDQLADDERRLDQLEKGTTH